MGPVYKVSKPKLGREIKRTVKFMGVCRDPRVQRNILQTAPDAVYKSFCNAFYNVAENPDINLKKLNRKALVRYQPIIRKIVAPNVKIRQKRKIIQRGGGFFLAAVLPAVISTALEFLGSAFIKKE
jgi:hypothetical protein